MSISNRIQLLSSVTSTGVSNIIQVENTIEHTIATHFSGSGSVSALVIDIEGSIDGSNFFSLTTSTGYTFTATDLTNKMGMFHVINRFTTYIRVNLVTLTKTGNIFVDSYYNYNGRKNFIGP